MTEPKKKISSTSKKPRSSKPKKQVEENNTAEQSNTEDIQTISSLADATTPTMPEPEVELSKENQETLSETPQPAGETIETTGVAKPVPAVEQQEIPVVRPISVQEIGADNVKFGNESSKKPINWASIFWAMGLIIVTISAAIACYYIYSLGSPEPQERTQQNFVPPVTFESTESTETTESSATPTEITVDRSLHNIKILNGSGITGEASRAKNYLESENFKVAEIGNADAANFSETVITVGKNVSKEYFEDLKEVLGKNYLISDEVELTDSDNEVTVIIGRTKSRI